MTRKIFTAVLATITSTQAIACANDGCDERQVAFHEGAHAVYGLSTGLIPTEIRVSRDDSLVLCPIQDPGLKLCGVVCYDSGFGAGHDFLWNGCSLSKSGRYGPMLCLGKLEHSDCHKSDDETAAENVAAVIKARSSGQPWLPEWPTPWTDDDEPTAAEILAECDRHAFETLAARRESLCRLGNVLDRDPDGFMSREEILAIVAE